ncbi:MAG: Dihydroorotate dehydrogenase (quinone), mitochondrial [Icmadophila ericetorum]|nr:Dihydroorotate dehydrogenase (quinone), mitochondrial [Icmadophila ericetorum]
MFKSGRLAWRNVPQSSVSANWVCSKAVNLQISRYYVASRAGALAHPDRRFASTSSQYAGDGRSLLTRLKNLALGTTIGGVLIFGYYYVTDTRSSIHRWLAVPALRWIYDDAEDAHEAGIKALKGLHAFGVHPRERGSPDLRGDLNVEVFGYTLSNPIGTSAGIDKKAEIPTPLLALGPAVVEVGGATPHPQDGNPKPRVFRLPSQKAMINRYGLNSEGADDMAMRLRQRVREYAYSMGYGLDEIAEQRILNGEAGVPPGSLTEGKLMAVQVAKNKFTKDSDIAAVRRDYVYCVNALAKYADIIVVNVSSPNTPGLRDLQKMEPLTEILSGVVEAARRVDRKVNPAVMVKVSPDEDSDQEVLGICEAVWKSGVDGVIVGNTTKRRPEPLPTGYSLSPKEAATLLEQGGYSGPQLFERTVNLVKRYRRFLDEAAARSHESTTETPRSSATPDDNLLNMNTGKALENSPVQNANSTTQIIEATPERDPPYLKEPTSKTSMSQSQPLFQLPERHNSPASGTSTTSNSSAHSASNHMDQLPNPKSITSPSPELSSAAPTSNPLPKVIFATGGITNGKQALEVLNAGASVAMVYTALVYGGVGTISRIKDELREEIRRKVAK